MAETIKPSPASEPETVLLVSKLQGRINLVLDTVKGRRNFRNLWGFHPVISQTLSIGGVGERIAPYCEVAGVRLEPDKTAVGSVDELIALAMEPYHPRKKVSYKEKSMYENYGRVADVTMFTTEAGIEFIRTALEETAHSDIQDKLPSFGHHARSLTWTVSAVSTEREKKAIDNKLIMIGKQ